MSLGPLPHTPNSARLTPLVMGVQAAPVHRKITPFCPTAKRFVDDEPQMPQISVAPFAFVIGDHRVPSNWSIVPPEPVAQMCDASSPHTSSSVFVVPLCIAVQ